VYVSLNLCYTVIDLCFLCRYMHVSFVAHCHRLNCALISVDRVTTCVENLEILGNLTAVGEMSRFLLKIREMSGKKSCQGKVA